MPQIGRAQHQLRNDRPVLTSGFGLIVPVVAEDAAAVPLRIVILATAQGIEKTRKANATQNQRNGYQISQDVHRGPRKRSAFNETVIEDVDMASAAINGVARPATAKGTAITL